MKKHFNGMKKMCPYLLFVILIGQPVYAQINWGDYSQSFPDGTTDNASTVALIIAIPKDNNSFWVANSDSKHFKVAEDSSFSQSRGANTVARTTFDTTRVHFFLHGVNEHNAARYQFRVTEYPTNEILVPWKAIDRYTDDTVAKDSGLPRMAYLGGYKTAFGNMVIMDVSRKNGNRIIATSLVAWESIKPIVSGIYTSDNFDLFFKMLQYPWAVTGSDNRRLENQDLLKLPPDNNNLIFYLQADIYKKEQLQYSLSRDGDVLIPWRTNEYDNSFVWLKENPPGIYVLRLRYSVQPQNISEYYFTVLPAWYQTSWFRIVAGVFILVFSGAFLFLVLFIRQTRKTKQESANKNRLQLELRYLYAQLNPHFVFNALSSIQGLVNRQDIKGANKYLSNFASLMRESLHRGNKEDVSLKEEIQTLEIYLKLEQLRFGFRYTISIDDKINIFDTSIPSLLLQPLIENAVKHGVSALRETGVVNIHFVKKEETLKAIITDNGKGFAIVDSPEGFGLKLTRERIKLLNALNKEQPVTFEIASGFSTGTQITITFNNWLS